jgi:hypothetical protein
MRNDPYAKLSGLDQKLFTASPKGPGNRAADTSKGKREQRPDVRSKERTSVGKKERRFQRTNVRSKERSSVRKKEGTFQRPVQPTKERLTERRPYDFFRDQLLWLNRTKVEIQEKYGQRVPATAMVRLAVDLLMQDHKRRKERSKLVTKLVSNQPTDGRPTAQI